MIELNQREWEKPVKSKEELIYEHNAKKYPRTDLVDIEGDVEGIDEFSIKVARDMALTDFDMKYPLIGLEKAEQERIKDLAKGVYGLNFKFPRKDYQERENQLSQSDRALVEDYYEFIMNEAIMSEYERENQIVERSGPTIKVGIGRRYNEDRRDWVSRAIAVFKISEKDKQ